jgi:hypothetical protein
LALKTPTAKSKLRSQLTGDLLLKSVRASFTKVPDHRAANSSYSLTDIITSCYSIFALKSSSMLAHESFINRKSIKNNFATIFNMEKVPSDTQMRTVLDEVETKSLQAGFVDTLGLAQKAGLLDDYKFLGEDIILSIDGTGFFCSNSVKCEHCQIKKRKSGKEYSHSMFSAVIVHPNKQQVLPIAPEPIVKQDGAKKNDHELKSAERLLRRFRQEYPNLKVTFVADGLFSKAPMVKLAQELGFNFIIGAKPKDHKYLFECFNKKLPFAGIDQLMGSRTPIVEQVTIEKNGVTHIFRFANGMSLNMSNDDVKVGFIEYTEISKKGTKYFSWVTNHKITAKNVFKLMKAARARWKIENETFNTLKNQGYNFEHNYGHGYQNLSNNMAMLMMHAFLVDQIQEICYKIFQQIRDRAGSRKSMWEAIRSFFSVLPVNSWAALLLLVLAEYPTQ